jgi:hypothetical protein
MTQFETNARASWVLRARSGPDRPAPPGRRTAVGDCRPPVISLVRSRRLELPRVAPQRPQRCASTNSATTARGEPRGVANRVVFVKGGRKASAELWDLARTPLPAGATAFTHLRCRSENPSPLVGEGGARAAKRSGRMRGRTDLSTTPLTDVAGCMNVAEKPVRPLILPWHSHGPLPLPQGEKGFQANPRLRSRASILGSRPRKAR